jgi:hypothetical protein
MNLHVQTVLMIALLVSGSSFAIADDDSAPAPVSSDGNLELGEPMAVELNSIRAALTERKLDDYVILQKLYRVQNANSPGDYFYRFVVEFKGAPPDAESEAAIMLIPRLRLIISEKLHVPFIAVDGVVKLETPIAVCPRYCAVSEVERNVDFHSLGRQFAALKRIQASWHPVDVERPPVPVRDPTGLESHVALPARQPPTDTIVRATRAYYARTGGTLRFEATAPREVVFSVQGLKNAVLHGVWERLAFCVTIHKRADGSAERLMLVSEGTYASGAGAAPSSQESYESSMSTRHGAELDSYTKAFGNHLKTELEK